MSDKLRETIEAMGLTEVLNVSSDDYEWDAFGAWVAPDGRYFWLTGAGCSCTYFGEDFESASEFSDGTRDDLERAFRAWASSAHEIDHVDVQDVIAKLRERH